MARDWPRRLLFARVRGAAIRQRCVIWNLSFLSLCAFLAFGAFLGPVLYGGWASGGAGEVSGGSWSAIGMCGGGGRALLGKSDILLVDENGVFAAGMRPEQCLTRMGRWFARSSPPPEPISRLSCCDQTL